LIKDFSRMMLRLIGGWLRETPQKSYTAGIAISIEAAMLCR
jgi:hypothetical protein